MSGLSLHKAPDRTLCVAGRKETLRIFAFFFCNMKVSFKVQWHKSELQIFPEWKVSQDEAFGTTRNEI